MSQRLIARAVSLVLAAVLTLGMLGTIEYLPLPDAAAPQWAKHMSTRA